jgi:hypothetical protein
MTRFLVATLLALTVSPVSADAIFDLGDLRLGFREAYQWAPTTIDKGGRSYMDAPNGNGTVVRYTGNNWSGSVHANAITEFAFAKVDGVFVPLAEGKSYSGSELHLERQVNLFNGYRLIHTLEASAAGIDETIRMIGLDAAMALDIAYPFLGSRAGRLGTYAGYNYLGQLKGMGTTNKQDDSYAYLPGGTTAVAQVDPLLGDGILTSWDASPSLSGSVFIWDASGSTGAPVATNKLYLRAFGLNGPANKDVSVGQHTRFFQLPPGEPNLSTMPVTVPEPSTLALLVAGAAVAFVSWSRKR